jgi:hypothetical protein
MANDNPNAEVKMCKRCLGRLGRNGRDDEMLCEPLSSKFLLLAIIGAISNALATTE